MSIQGWRLAMGQPRGLSRAGVEYTEMDTEMDTEILGPVVVHRSVTRAPSFFLDGSLSAFYSLPFPLFYLFLCFPPPLLLHLSVSLSVFFFFSFPPSLLRPVSPPLFCRGVSSQEVSGHAPSPRPVSSDRVSCVSCVPIRSPRPSVTCPQTRDYVGVHALTTHACPF